jgi:tetraacyldisaccharide 4'-kinase
VGNLTVGGTGKTPLTLWMADVLLDMGFNVVVSVSGYGSPHVKGATVASGGELDPGEWGDEAALFRWRRPELPLVVGRKRAIAARLVKKHFPGHVMLMDDGFQHLAFAPTVSIVLDPPRTNEFCLPAGPYREPRGAGRRKAAALVPGTFALRTSGLVLDCEGVPSEVDLLCAVGSPSRLLLGVEEAGIKVVNQRIEADHDPLDAPRLLDGLGDGRPLLVTAKDWVKLKHRNDLGGRAVIVADYRASLEPEDQLRAWIGDKLLERLDSPSR